MDVRFTPTRFRAGYDVTEVDDFLDRCDQALSSGDGSVTAQSVLEMRFNPTQFQEGYDMDEVDAFLDDVLAPRFAALAPGAAAEQVSPVLDAGSGSLSPAGPAPGTGLPAPRPVPHPAEKRGGFFSRLFRGR